jgi:hypothetical protein
MSIFLIMMSDASQLERLDIKLPSGIVLEGTLITPTSVPQDGAKLAICLHPWSRLGGSMDDPYVHFSMIIRAGEPHDH